MADAHQGSRKTIDVLARASVIYAVLLAEGDASRDELIARVRKQLGRTAYGKAPEDSLLRDLGWLERLGFEVDRLPGHLYRLGKVEPRFPLPLTHDHVEALAAVQHAFARTLYGQPIDELVRRLRPYVDPNLRLLLDREPLLKLNTPLVDYLFARQATFTSGRWAGTRDARVRDEGYSVSQSVNRLLALRS